MSRYISIPVLLPLAAIAAVFATLCDANHVYTGTLTYLDPSRFGKTWTVFPSFLIVFLIIMILYDRLFTRLPAGVSKLESTSAGNLQTCLESFGIFVLVYLMSGFGSEYPVLLNIIFYGAFGIRWMVTYDRVFILLFSIVLGIGGMAGEGLLAAAGLVEYSRPEVFHVPWWLGGVYLHGALALREIMRYFAYREGPEYSPGGGDN